MLRHQPASARLLGLGNLGGAVWNTASRVRTARSGVLGLTFYCVLLAVLFIFSIILAPLYMRHPSHTKYTNCLNVLALPQTFALAVPFWNLSLPTDNSPLNFVSFTPFTPRINFTSRRFQVLDSFWLLWLALIIDLTIAFFKHKSHSLPSCSSSATNMPIYISGDNSKATIHRYNRYNGDTVGLVFVLFFMWWSANRPSEPSHHGLHFEWLFYYFVEIAHSHSLPSLSYNRR